MWTQAYKVEEHALRKLRLPAGYNNSWVGYTGGGQSNGSFPVEQPPFPAPHLLCCEELRELRRKQEERGGKGEDPPWTLPLPGHHSDQEPYPRPPWVQGAPKDNLPLTHKVQTEIWLRQFPPDRCASESTRFLVTWWHSPEHHGMGSHFHIITGMLGLGLSHNRVLTFLNWTFTRAIHDGCSGEDAGRLECYFFPSTYKECNDRATAHYQSLSSQQRNKKVYTKKMLIHRPNISDILDSPERFVVVSPRIFGLPQFSRTPPSLWNDTWRRINVSAAYGLKEPLTPWQQLWLPVSWWRAQGTRFLLRWPSSYLCNIVNFARHQSYGLEVAAAVLKPEELRPQQLQRQVLNPQQLLPQGLNPQEPLPFLANLLTSFSCHRHNSCCCRADVDAMPGLDPAALLHPRALAPRPLVRMHIRGSDKARETVLFDFPAHVRALEGLRANSSLRNVSCFWLSSEDKWPFDEARKLKNWTVYSVEMERKHRGKRDPLDQWKFATKYGLREYVEASLANLIIGVEADGFLFNLGSNWDRVCNELRVTSGKLHAPVVVLHHWEN